MGIAIIRSNGQNRKRDLKINKSEDKVEGEKEDRRSTTKN